MNTIYDIAQKCKDFMEHNISLKKNRLIKNNFIFNDYDIIGDIKQLESLLKNLHNAIQNKYPSIASDLTHSMNSYNNDKIIHISKIEAIVNCIFYIEKPSNGKRIFISHSSKDEQIISNFVDHILCLGIGINRNDIFCTSIEDISIRNGEDIRNHIQNNLRNSDYSFLFISDNYKKSEICLNEMGAVWCYDSNVKLYLLPNTDFNNIGWIYDTRKVNKLTDTVALDQLYKNMCDSYSLPDNLVNWSQQREIFIKNIQLINHNILLKYNNENSDVIMNYPQ